MGGKKASINATHTQPQTFLHQLISNFFTKTYVEKEMGQRGQGSARLLTVGFLDVCICPAIVIQARKRPRTPHVPRHWDTVVMFLDPCGYKYFSSFWARRVSQQ
jgi:hypothetical protein